MYHILFIENILHIENIDNILQEITENNLESVTSVYFIIILDIFF